MKRPGEGEEAPMSPQPEREGGWGMWQARGRTGAEERGEGCGEGGVAELFLLLLDFFEDLPEDFLFRV